MCGIVKQLRRFAPPPYIPISEGRGITADSVKFGLEDFISNADSEFRALGSAAWERFPHVVASLATARRSEHRTQISQIPYHLIIVDEAYHLKNPPALLGSSSTNAAYTFCCSLSPRSKTIWMSYTT